MSTFRDPDFLVRTFLAAIFVGVGLLFTFLVGKVSILTCSRFEDANRCVLLVSWMELSPLSETRIESLQNAWVEDSCDSDGCTYRVVLQTPRESIPLTDSYTSGQSSKENITAQINAFLDDRSIPDLRVKDGGGLWLILPLIFVGAGVFLAINPLRTALHSLFSKS